jgi:hypothetical protein
MTRSNGEDCILGVSGHLRGYESSYGSISLGVGVSKQINELVHSKDRGDGYASLVYPSLRPSNQTHIDLVSFLSVVSSSHFSHKLCSLKHDSSLPTYLEKLDRQRRQQTR